MDRREFQYQLPPNLIASTPAEPRSAARLLHVDIGADACAGYHFNDLPGLLRQGDLLVFNDTRVIRARLLGRKATGGAVEFLIERILGDRHAVAQARASKPLREGARVEIEPGLELEVEARDVSGWYRLRSPPGIGFLELTERHGHVPLPPYIDRPDTAIDAERYQSVFARVPGAVAAPTASLHFDAALLDRLRDRGIGSAFVTLHVGAGTFTPMRTRRIEDHRMHPEFIDVGSEVCAAIDATRKIGARVIAVGTTVVRALETAAAAGAISPWRGDTDLFIRPGHRFRAIDALITNFHLPESSLLVLVAAYAGRERILSAYAHAIAARYRFYSYGDAMLLTGGPVQGDA